MTVYRAKPVNARRWYTETWSDGARSGVPRRPTTPHCRNTWSVKVTRQAPADGPYRTAHAAELEGPFWLAARMDKHGLYYNLLDAFALPGCPLCRLSVTSVTRWLGALSYENINDTAVRTRLRRSRGLCTVHAWHLLDEERDLLGTAIICKDILDTHLHSLGGLLGAPESPWSRPVDLSPVDLRRQAAWVEPA